MAVKVKHIKLGPKDSAMIVRGDGTQELLMPEMENEDDVACDSAVAIMLAAVTLNQKEIFEMAMKFLNGTRGHAEH